MKRWDKGERCVRGWVRGWEGGCVRGWEGEMYWCVVRGVAKALLPLSFQTTHSSRSRWHCHWPRWPSPSPTSQPAPDTLSNAPDRDFLGCHSATTTTKMMMTKMMRKRTMRCVQDHQPDHYHCQMMMMTGWRHLWLLLEYVVPNAASPAIHMCSDMMLTEGC